MFQPFIFLPFLVDLLPTLSINKIPGLFGFFIIMAICFIMSNNYKYINYRIVFSGLFIQFTMAFFALKTSFGLSTFKSIGYLIAYIIDGSARMGADFVFGVLVRQEVLSETFGIPHSFIFFFNVLSTIILMSILVNLAYYFGIMQRIIGLIAKIVYKLMNISGVEAVSNVASAFVGQVEAQIMIKPYLKNMTKSELLASMTGSMSCIAGSVMVIYVGFGIPSEYLLTASIMSAPGALVVSKIVFPETEKTNNTNSALKLELKKESTNIIEIISQGCNEGLKISLNITTMLIGFMSLIALVNMFLTWISFYIGIPELSMQYILGKVFSIFAWLLGIPIKDIDIAGSLLGTKFVINEFIAYLQLKDFILIHNLNHRTVIILSVALCGFANIGSIGVQVGGIGGLVPERIKDLSSLGFKALICGTLTSYLSATIVGLLI